ncbi:cob(I)alamin adenosyltransferase [Thermotomaculum hydrothermale]|uniref:corrinoid adenosyltransferase n=1 Tax=Thermotomaculum hydrothermale TaxID=981385 RepID=A0A7R6PPH1_9BACT|nr:cob(I)yrinic acid a,c-diamide adenosyltransferase [Thermotomaculum hydrothermale]BBB33428.1 cob(I)alamin adenosyltransferase [Thermotomaculum hydrothermale]
MNFGFVHVYTGNGKGKTTAAFGLALRAAGNGYKTFIGQFLKGVKYGELEIEKFTNGLVKVKQFGKPDFVHEITEEDIKLAKKGFEECKKAIFSGEYQIVILDEINVAIYFKLIETKEVIELIKNKPEGVEIVLTGRYAPEELIEIADLVTEMKEIKHYFQRGIQAREGIER